MSEQVPMLCQDCGWRGVAGEVAIDAVKAMHCPRCDSRNMAQVLGAPIHQDPDK